MKFRNKPQKKTEYNEDKVRVRNSYYTFSREYPSKNILHRRKGVRKRIRRNRLLKALTGVICFCLIALMSCFATDLMLKISYKPLDTSAQQSQSEDKNVISFSEGVRAWYLPTDALSDRDYLKHFVSSVKRRGANAVLIDFKDENGRLCYSSSDETAILSKAAVYDNETVRNALSYIKSERLSVIARIYCFQDNTASAGNSALAVTYLDSDVNWLDENGKAWLNPFSKRARGYVLEILEETLSFSVDGIMLEAVSFPYGGATDTLGYRGQKDDESRNDVLKSFISSAKKKMPEEKPLFVSLTATDAVKGSKAKYEGSISKNAADGLSVYVAQSPDGYIIDKKSKYQSLMSLLSKISSSASENAEIVPVLEGDTYTRSLKRALMKNGYRSFIVTE